MSETEDHRKRERLAVKWKDRIKEYMHETGADRGEGIELTRRECMDREGWRLFCRG